MMEILAGVFIDASITDKIGVWDEDYSTLQMKNLKWEKH